MLRAFIMSVKLFFIFSLVNAGGFSAIASAAQTSDLNFDESFAISYLKLQMSSGLASARLIQANLHAAELALIDWKLSCENQDTDRLKQIIRYGEIALEKQMVWGTRFLADPLFEQLARARQLAQQGKCNQLKSSSWRASLSRLKRKLQ